MGRKVAQIGPSTLMISLPRKWTRQWNVRKGDELDIVEKERNLIVQQKNSQQPTKTITIKLDDLNTTVAWYYLTAAYRSGADEIQIQINSPILYDEGSSTIYGKREKETVSTFEFIKSAVSRFIGMEIIRHSKNVCTIKEISSIKEEELKTMQRRIFFSLTNTLDDIVTALKKKDKDMLHHIYLHSDTNINKFSDYCLRILAKTGNRNPTTYTTIVQLEEIGDALKHIAYSAMQKEEKKEVQQLITDLKNLFPLVEKFYYTNDRNVFIEFETQRRQLKKRIFLLSKNTHPTIIMMVTNILNQSLVIMNSRLLQVD